MIPKLSFLNSKGRNLINSVKESLKKTQSYPKT